MPPMSARPLGPRKALAAAPLVLWTTGCILDTSCVAAGTPVATPDGWRPIEALRPGDPIYAVDVATGALVPALVAHTRSATRECVAIVDDRGAELLVTADHPVYAVDHAAFVDAGHFVLGRARTLLVIDDLAPERRATPRPAGPGRTFAGVHEVLDLGVTGDHPTFIAGGVVVHNKTVDCKATPSFCSGTATDTAADTTTGTTDTTTSTATSTTDAATTDTTGGTSTTTTTTATTTGAVDPQGEPPAVGIAPPAPATAPGRG